MLPKELKKLKKQITDEVCRMFPAALVFAIYDAVWWIWYDEADQRAYWGE
jgi:hypothetical protein